MGRGSDADGLGLFCRCAGALTIRNHSFGQIHVIQNFTLWIFLPYCGCVQSLASKTQVLASLEELGSK